MGQPVHRRFFSVNSVDSKYIPFALHTPFAYSRRRKRHLLRRRREHLYHGRVVIHALSRPSTVNRPRLHTDIGPYLPSPYCIVQGLSMRFRYFFHQNPGILFYMFRSHIPARIVRTSARRKIPAHVNESINTWGSAAQSLDVFHRCESIRASAPHHQTRLKLSSNPPTLDSQQLHHIFAQTHV